MTPELFQAVSNNLADHEGRKLSMYRDTVGVVTCGVGHALFTVEDACKLEWWRSHTERATKGYIISDYCDVKAGGTGKLLMTYEETDAILSADLAKFEKLLYGEFPHFDDYPVSVQVAMFDIAFNCGSFAKWPHLTKYIKLRMWDKAADECNRPAVGKIRNEATRQQFLQPLNTRAISVNV